MTQQRAVPPFVVVTSELAHFHQNCINVNGVLYTLIDLKTLIKGTNGAGNKNSMMDLLHAIQKTYLDVHPVQKEEDFLIYYQLQFTCSLVFRTSLHCTIFLGVLGILWYQFFVEQLISRYFGYPPICNSLAVVVYGL